MSTLEGDRVALRNEFGGLGKRSLQLGRQVQQVGKFRVPAVRAGQRPVRARNGPLGAIVRQGSQTPLVAAANSRKEVLDSLDIRLRASRSFHLHCRAS